MIKEDLIRSHRPRALKRSPQFNTEPEKVKLVFYYKHRHYTKNVKLSALEYEIRRITRDGGQIISKTNQ